MSPVVSATAYDAARRRAAVLDRSDRGRIVVSGADRASYLQGLLTNDISALKAGQGCYAAYLTPQGRMIADLWVYELGDALLLSCHADVKNTVLAKLDQFVFSEDVQLGDVTDTFAGLAIVGPEAAEIVGDVLDRDGHTAMALAEQGNLRATFRGRPAILLRQSDIGVPGFDVLVETAARDILIETLRERHVAELSGAAAEMVRIES